MQNIGRGSKLDQGVDFAWTLHNGADVTYRPYSSIEKLEDYLRAEGVRSFQIVWDGDDYEVLSDSLTLDRDLREAGEAFNRARAELAEYSSELYAAIAAACADGLSEVQAAKIADVDRMTVRRALGKL